MPQVKVSFSNSKLGHAIASINIPTCVCLADAPCRSTCYANKSHWLYKNVQERLKENLDAFNEDAEKFFNDIAFQTRLMRFVRWHSSGEIVNERYLEGMVKVAKMNKGVEYLCFTKKYKLVNAYLDSHKLPKNLHMVFSGWGAQWEVVNPHNLPTSWVMFKDKRENVNIPEIAIPCAGSCENCLACWQLKKGQSVYFKKH